MVQHSYENGQMKRGRYTAKIPERRVFYSPDKKRSWDAMWTEWLKSGRKDESVWQEFRVL